MAAAESFRVEMSDGGAAEGVGGKRGGGGGGGGVLKTGLLVFSVVINIVLIAMVAFVASEYKPHSEGGGIVIPGVTHSLHADHEKVVRQSHTFTPPQTSTILLFLPPHPSFV